MKDENTVNQEMITPQMFLKEYGERLQDPEFQKLNWEEQLELMNIEIPRPIDGDLFLEEYRELMADQEFCDLPYLEQKKNPIYRAREEICTAYLMEE